MPRNEFVEVVDTLLLEKGEQKNKHWCAIVTSSEILQALQKDGQRTTHRNTKALVTIHYPGTRFEPIGVNGANGWKFYIRVRTK